METSNLVCRLSVAIASPWMVRHPWKGRGCHVNHLNFGGHNHISGRADHLRRCQLSSPVSVINFWRSAAMLITSTVEICSQHLGRVEEMVFAPGRSYDSAVLGIVILSVRLSHACFVRTYRRYFYTTWKGNPSSQMWFFVQLCSSWQDFNWLKALRGPSAIAELLVLSETTFESYFGKKTFWCAVSVVEIFRC